MNRIVVSVAAAVLLASAAPVVVATEGDTEPLREQQLKQLFVQIDRNGDGMIDAAEAKSDKGLASAFPRVARNGMLDRNQFVAWYRTYDMEAALE